MTVQLFYLWLQGVNIAVVVDNIIGALQAVLPLDLAINNGMNLGFAIAVARTAALDLLCHWGIYYQNSVHALPLLAF